MNEPLESLYFNWLCAKVIVTDKSTPSLTHWKLLRLLHNTEFIWQLMGDDNRAEDGMDLRYEFVMAADIPDDEHWRTESGCSLLEMFIGFSRRAEFQTGDRARDWFWEFMTNLGLEEWNDGSDVPEEQIVDVLDTLVWRTYNANGYGGIFPLDNPTSDQRKVEIWYQFCDYLVDKDRLP
jgi:hypothetical protein